MDAWGWTLFDTPLGRCGLLWSPRGVRCLHLPAAEPEIVAELRACCPGAATAAPPPAMAALLVAVRRLLAGEPAVLDGVLDDGDLPAFRRRVYAEVRRIPAGCTATYGEVAAALGAPGAARAVGQALGRNPFALIVPCHRVVGAAGLGGFTAAGGVDLKLRLLEIEGALRSAGGRALA